MFTHTPFLYFYFSFMYNSKKCKRDIYNLIWGEPVQMSSWTPPGSDSPLQEEKRNTNKQLTNNQQRGMLVLITWKGVAAREKG